MYQTKKMCYNSTKDGWRDIMPMNSNAVIPEEEKSKLAAMYAEYKDLMCYMAYQILRDNQETEDIVHQAFIRIMNIREYIGDVYSTRTRSLLITITKRLALDLYRKRKNHNIVTLNNAYTDSITDIDIENVYESDEILAALSDLPSKYRNLLILRYHYGLQVNDIANILSMSKANVYKTILRAKSKLLEILESTQGIIYAKEG